MNTTAQFIMPRIYAIVDADCFKSAADLTGALARHARELVAGGVTVLQYRNKAAGAREMLEHAREIRRELLEAGASRGVRLIMNDRADLCLAAEFDGVHLGQDDLPPLVARSIVGQGRLLGYSTHNPEQVKEADSMPVNYIAVGPVFATTSKANPDPVIGIEGIRLARSLTRKPLVAIGGITQDTCRAVIEAGADSVAIISGLLETPRQSAALFLRILSCSHS